MYFTERNTDQTARETCHFQHNDDARFCIGSVAAHNHNITSQDEDGRKEKSLIDLRYT